MHALDKKTEEEVLKVYHAGFDAFMAGSVEMIRPLLHENVQVIGTTEEEKFKGRELYLNALSEIFKQVLGIIEYRNREIQVKGIGNVALVEEFSDLFLKLDGQWVFYNKNRISTLFEHGEAGWLSTYQHSSFPDSSAETGETFGLQRIQKENTELREAVRRRTTELELKNRELEVEAALERVRAQALAMQRSSEIKEVAATMRNELLNLGIEGVSAATIWLEQPTGKIRAWDFTIVEDTSLDKDVQVDIEFDPKDAPPRAHFHKIWNRRGNYWVGESDLDDLYESVNWLKNQDEKAAEDMIRLLDSGELKYWWHPTTVLAKGRLNVDLVVPPPKEMAIILPKMAAAFDLAYRRFEDLQKAEAQAREAKIEAALERVRSRVTAMRHSDELSEAAELLYQEFFKLGVESFSCGYLINDDEKGEWKIWLTNPGEPFFKEFWTAPYDADHKLEARYESWKRQEAFHCAVLEGEENRAHHLVISQYAPWKADMIDFLPPRLVFNSAHFSLGHLLVISPDRLAPELEQALVRFAGVFDLAYRRFLDLQATEEQAALIKREKERLEKALHDLQATQSQLIQQEKLASLGQLTAGIAHEIKNPLNFVNNFSEVSKELLDDLREEIDNQDWGEVKAIITALQQNLDKIRTHGTRADGIVRSMLLHSRGGSGVREPTDLNTFVREYVNLAFHGMRAGKQPINVAIDLELDDQAGTIPLVVEDFSRVILNLCNNAFDAMRSKLQEEGGNGYQPRLSVRTCRTGSGIRIEVADNGSGIPEKIRDKVLQPFFTTKKGTEGTGLGLSISNDIVKAHQGKLTIVTEPGSGTIFKIEIPNG